MEVHRLAREFLYNGVKLLDTTPAMNRTFALLKPARQRRHVSASLFVDGPLQKVVGARES